MRVVKLHESTISFVITFMAKTLSDDSSFGKTATNGLATTWVRINDSSENRQMIWDLLEVHQL